MDEPRKSSRLSAFTIHERNSAAGAPGVLHRIFGWFFNFQKAAAKQREIYQKEGNYTVADCIPKDVRTIETANFPIILILAAPGTPTMALIHRITDAYNLYHMNIGALLQREIELETKRHDEVHHLMHRGIAIPRAFIFEMIRRQIANICRKKEHKGFILTEYPSTFSQTNDFFDYICKPDFVLYIKFSDKLTQENIFIYLKFQVRASKVLRKLHPDIQAVSMEQAQKFRRDVGRIAKKYPEQFKTVDASLPPDGVCREITKWIERSAVMHNIIPPLFVEPPLPEEEEPTDV